MAATWLFICAILGTTLPLVGGEKVLGRENDEFDFDGLPGASHEFKVSVPAGREECFFQNIVQNGKLHVSFEVLSGGDQTLDLKVWTPHGNLLHHIQVSASGGFEQQVFETGPYAICLDNSMSRLNSKLVYMYIVTYVQDEWHEYIQEIEALHITMANFTDQWHEFIQETEALQITQANFVLSRSGTSVYVQNEWHECIQEIEDLHITMTNFTVSLDMVKNSISDAIIHQAQSRMHIIKDWYLISGNNTYITTWSILQCCVIVISSVCQVYFLRRLFRYTNVKPAKPRA